MLHTCQIMPLSHVCIALYHEQVSALIYCLIGLSRIMAYLFVSVWPWAINSLWMLRVCAFILHRCICMTGFVFLCVFDTAPFLNVNVMWMRQIYGRCKNSLRLVSLAHHRCHSVLCWSSLAPFIHHMLLTHFFYESLYSLQNDLMPQSASLCNCWLVINELEADSVAPALFFVFSQDSFKPGINGTSVSVI